MKRGMGRIGVLLLLVAASVVFTVPALVGGQQQEIGYWDKFKMLFVDWDDNAQPGTPRTQVTGVRGLNVEQALGGQGYDWNAVKYMEDYKVSVNDEMKFLQDGKLGPYQGK